VTPGVAAHVAVSTPRQSLASATTRLSPFGALKTIVTTCSPPWRGSPSSPCRKDGAHLQRLARSGERAIDRAEHAVERLGGAGTRLHAASARAANADTASTAAMANLELRRPNDEADIREPF
jgi:hypothetical protein